MKSRKYITKKNQHKHTKSRVNIPRTGNKLNSTVNSKHATDKNKTLKHRTNQQINGGGLKDIMNRFLGRKQSYTLPQAPQPVNQHITTSSLYDDEPKDNIDKIYNEYLECVDIIESFGITSLELKQKIMSSSFGSVNQFRNMLNGISLVLPTFNDKPKSEWVDCIDDCQDTLSSAISKELNSTAYMLRVLSMSLVNDKSEVPTDQRQNPCFNSFGGKIQFYISGSAFYGIWEKDKHNFKMIITHPQQQQGMNTSATQTTGRLIMGFGPSASGKTHCAAKVIQLMQKVEPGFPSVFITIDGGLYREKSVVYQTITSDIKEKAQYTGLTNLVASGPIGSSLFKSEIIKKAVVEYLNEFKRRNPKKHINVYVPETLGSCQSLTDDWGFKQCINKYDVYKKLTGDENWVGLMIYQHITPDKCIYNNKYKCVGTKQSGETRAQNEGKEYSSGAWQLSYENGNAAVSAAPKYRFRIHNGGAPGKWSIFEDQSVPPLIEDQTKTLIDTSRDNSQSENNNRINPDNILSFLNSESVKWKYISGKIKDSSQCAEYVEPMKFYEICERLSNAQGFKRRFTVKKIKPAKSPDSRILQLREINSDKNVNNNNYPEDSYV